MGRRAAEILIHEIEDENEVIIPSDIILETNLIVREST
jgi:DNA-binding LacI/PurR family transcriptional regulator